MRNPVPTWLLWGLLAGSSPAEAAPAAWAHLFPGTPDLGAAADRCGTDTACALRWLYRGDPAAAQWALAMWQDGEHLAGVEQDHLMDGGFRGTIRIRGELPVGAQRRHLQWVQRAGTAQAAFFARVFQGCPAPRYRWRALAYHFFRSVGRRTPSAYAADWSIAYNLAGSLNTSGARVEELLFHELFHLNDQAHGGWADTALGPLHTALRARCGNDKRCLAAYAPVETAVRGGNWYAFHADNGPGEYAAELAVRYWRETRTVFSGGRVRRPFKCGNADNARAWRALVDEMFCGVDVVGDCP